MTLIECFDRSPVENIVGCLQLQPERLIFIGDETRMQPRVERYRAFLKARRMDTQVLLRHIPKQNMAEIAAVLADIVRTEEECVFDVTGGDERVLLAMGAVLAGLNEDRRKKVSVQKFDLRSGTAQDCDGDGQIVPGTFAALTAQESIALHGGVIHPGGVQPPTDCTPADLQKLWSVVCADPRSWNRSIAALNEFESKSDSKTQIYLDRDMLSQKIGNYGEKERLVEELLEKFSRRGVIDDRSDAYSLSYTYPDPVLHECVKKAGNILEMKTLLEARALRENGEPYFYDCQMGVTIDWDGVVFDSAQHVAETRNEIDVILTRGLIPLFISCKNGSIGEEELYKLNTVATRFGGRCVRKMLIATDLDRKSAAANRSFIQRARDMNIYLVTDAAELSDEEWENVLKTAMGC